MGEVGRSSGRSAVRAGACTVPRDGNFPFDLAQSKIKIGVLSSEGPVKQLWCWSHSLGKPMDQMCSYFNK